MSLPSFEWSESHSPNLPLFISSPHSGTLFPERLREAYLPEHLEKPSDTDWHIPRLYQMAVGLGIPMLQAKYSRFVADLNRPKTEESLYKDGRQETGLFPLNTFSGDPLYKEGYQITDHEKKLRLEEIYLPYHAQLQKKIDENLKKFGKVFLFEAHSIKHFVPKLYPEKLPDLIIGNNEGLTSSNILRDEIYHVLKDNSLGLRVAMNAPFKGGFITRNYGDPSNNIHVIQLEMAQNIYMDESTYEYEEAKASKVSLLLKELFQRATSVVETQL